MNRKQDQPVIVMTISTLSKQQPQSLWDVDSMLIELLACGDKGYWRIGGNAFTCVGQLPKFQ
jgi:hypothetical protein